MGIGSKGGSTPTVISGVGFLNDFVNVPYVFGANSILAHLNTAYYHVHGQPFCYPELADDITIASGAGIWGTGGSIIEVIPADTLNVSAFDLHWINLSNPDSDAYYYLEIYKGLVASEILIGCTRFWRDSTFFGGQTGAKTKRIQVSQQVVNERISCKLYSSNVGAASVDVSFEGHYYA